jgi:peptidoglycan/LPS O-acetylase OafA/YrhL
MMEIMSGASGPYRRSVSHAEARVPELDIVRLLAALAVLVFHYKSKYVESIGIESQLGAWIHGITKFGYLGVDLFFVTSGFVICASASGRSATAFLISRITRIYPTFWVCATITAVVALLLRSPDQSQVSLAQWAANLTLFHKYFGVAHLDGVYWTLLVEIKFYLCVAVLLALGWFNKFRVWLTIWLALTAVFQATGQPFFMGMFISPEYSPYFIAGITFFLVRRDGLDRWSASILLGTLVLACTFAYGAISDFTRRVDTSDRLIAAGLVVAIYGLFTMIALKRFHVRETVRLTRLGGMTYGIYLLHNAAGKDIYEALHGRVAALPLLLAIAVGVLVLAYVIHVQVERRIADRLKTWLLAVTGSRSRTSAAGPA